ncbi:hypothetical protein [Aureimonas pseudogalii]|uniref:DUF4407 domain-containing protein n=1 Tax=Aureimonas pseudogalii TaxID=1744844 RepID=A0A7W6EB50_9HYPH|nr:hypothetical protein [Aureimonas pseudogalii]MBB3998106.1 hypothetical protein [Aureimonas pseudogalii]
MAASHSYTLRGQIARLELTTRMTLAILATASGVFTYLGVRELLDGDATTVFFGAVIYSVSVSVGIYAFWTYLMRIMPHVRRPAGRRMLYLAMALGAGMIMAMSAWLNAAALAGAAALEQHMSVTTEAYQGKLNEAHENALAAQSLLPDIQLASQRFARLADEERSSGALTGTSGSGTVVQLLSQMSTQLAGLQSEIESSRTAVSALFKDGGERLGEMRRLVAAEGSVKPRLTDYGAQATELAGIIGSLQQTSVAPAVRRAAEDLGRTFIAPAADGTDVALQDRQTAVVGQVEAVVRQQSAALAAAADAILERPRVETVRFLPLSAPEAVVMYARDFLPSWAGAISIDLMPAVLVFILCIVQDQIRREEGEEDSEIGDMSAVDMLRAMRLQRRLMAEGGHALPVEPVVVGDEIVQQNEPGAVAYPKTVRS